MKGRAFALVVASALGCQSTRAAPHSIQAIAPLDSGAAPTHAPSATSSPGSLPTALANDGLDHVYQGTLGANLAVVARLQRSGTAVTGRYFYENTGSDLALEGTLDATGHLALDERVAAKKTGHFEGVFADDGSWGGTWTDAAGKRRLSFQFRRVAPTWATGAPVPLFKKHVHWTMRPPEVDPNGMLKACSLDADYPEIAGVFDPAVEAKLNAALHIDLAVPGSTCEIPESGELHYRVTLNRAALLAVVFDFDWCCGAHPSSNRVFVNLAVPAGETLALAGLLAPGARPKLVNLLRPLVNKNKLEGEDLVDVGEVLDQLTREPAEFGIEERGLRFSAFNSQPHVVQALYADGFFVPYPKLAGILSSPGPLDPLR